MVMKQGLGLKIDDGAGVVDCGDVFCLKLLLF